MTPDRALKNDILPGSAAAPKSRGKRARREKKQRPIWLSMLIRATIMCVGLLAARVLLFTEPGQQLMAMAEDMIATVIAEEMAARNAGAGDTDPTSAAAQADTPAPGAKRISLHETKTTSGVSVTAMPESRVTIRRAGE